MFSGAVAAQLYNSQFRDFHDRPISMSQPCWNVLIWKYFSPSSRTNFKSLLFLDIRLDYDLRGGGRGRSWISIKRTSNAIFNKNSFFKNFFPSPPSPRFPRPIALLISSTIRVDWFWRCLVITSDSFFPQFCWNFVNNSQNSDKYFDWTSTTMKSSSRVRRDVSFAYFSTNYQWKSAQTRKKFQQRAFQL